MRCSLRIGDRCEHPDLYGKRCGSRRGLLCGTRRQVKADHRRAAEALAETVRVLKQELGIGA